MLLLLGVSFSITVELEISIIFIIVEGIVPMHVATSFIYFQRYTSALNALNREWCCCTDLRNMRLAYITIFFFKDSMLLTYLMIALAQPIRPYTSIISNIHFCSCIFACMGVCGCGRWNFIVV